MEAKTDESRDTFVNFYEKEGEIQTLVDGFRNRTLPASKWTHEAHLVTGLWFASRFTALESICYLRSGIIAYNVATGGENTPERGYHETLTLFWCRILHHFVTKNRSLTPVELCNRFLNSEWSSKELPFQYYSRELLFSVEARATWVQPDLQEF